MIKNYGAINLPLDYRGKDFQFLKAKYLVELTGKKAKNLEEFISILKNAEPSTLFYHVYHPLLESHLVPYEYPNDFSFWFSDSLQDKDLAEQVANIELPKEGGLEELRETMLAKLERALARGTNYQVRQGNEFHFVKCRFAVYPNGFMAKNLNELADGIYAASEQTVIFHMVTSRLFRNSRYDDFSAWIMANTEEKDLAEQLGRIDPTTHVSVRGMQKEVIDVLQRYLRNKIYKR